MESQSNPWPDGLVKFMSLCALIEVFAKDKQSVEYYVKQLHIEIACNNDPVSLVKELEQAFNNLVRLYHNIESTRGTHTIRLLETILKIGEEVIQNPNIRLHTIAHFSSKYNISAATLTRSFKKYYRMTLHEFVTKECIKKARMIMQNETHSMEYIAEQLGYADRSGLSKTMKRFNKE